jgi:hypothetical protein
MNVFMDVALAEGYSSPSQKARRITEGWFESNMYCPCCVNERFAATRGSNPVVDFVCASCGAEFQIKGKSGPPGRKLRDAAYGYDSEHKGRPNSTFCFHALFQFGLEHSKLAAGAWAFYYSRIHRKMQTSITASSACRMDWMQHPY